MGSQKNLTVGTCNPGYSVRMASDADGERIHKEEEICFTFQERKGPGTDRAIPA